MLIYVFVDTFHLIMLAKAIDHYRSLGSGQKEERKWTSFIHSRHSSWILFLYSIAMFYGRKYITLETAKKKEGMP